MLFYNVTLLWKKKSCDYNKHIALLQENTIMKKNMLWWQECNYEQNSCYDKSIVMIKNITLLEYKKVCYCGFKK